MRISVSLTSFSWPDGPAALARDLARVVRAADDAGLHTVWLADHMMQADPASRPEEPFLEAYTTLGYLAGQSERVRLGAMVSPVTFREPAVLVKAVTSLDVLSGGRAWFGVGAGYEAGEAGAFGLPLPPVAERFERLEETLRIAGAMWSGATEPVTGRHYSLGGPVSRPLPSSRPHPPVMIGGTGERHTLRLVAQYADACNLFDIPDEGKTIRHKVEVLHRHCEAVGRDPAEIDHTVSTALGDGESADQVAGRSQVLAGLGIQHATFIVRGRPFTTADVAVLGEVAAAEI